MSDNISEDNTSVADNISRQSILLFLNFGKLFWFCSCTRFTACLYKTNSAEISEVGLACSGGLFFLI